MPTEPLVIADAPSLGDPAAGVVLVEFSDFQCPYCATFARERWPAIKAEYVDSGRLRLVYRHLPLEGLHPEAWRAAEATTCAERQGRFWEMHHALFADSADLSEAGLAQHAANLDLDMAKFESCMVDETATVAVREDVTLAASLDATGTPTFFIGDLQDDGRVVVTDVRAGVGSAEQFRTFIEGALSEAD